MMMISALSRASTGAASPVSGEVTVTMALTSSPPTGRYSFWAISTVKSVLIGRFLLRFWCGGRERGQDHRDVVRAAGLQRELHQRRGRAQRVAQRPPQPPPGPARGGRLGVPQPLATPPP